VSNKPKSISTYISQSHQTKHIYDRRKFKAKLPTIWTDEKQRWEESEKRREEERRSRKRKSPKKEDPGAKR